MLAPCSGVWAGWSGRGWWSERAGRLVLGGLHHVRGARLVAHEARSAAVNDAWGCSTEVGREGAGARPMGRFWPFNGFAPRVFLTVVGDRPSRGLVVQAAFWANL